MNIERQLETTNARQELISRVPAVDQRKLGIATILDFQDTRAPPPDMVRNESRNRISRW